MIKNEMSLTLDYSDTNVAGTINAVLLSNSDILPYAVGYIPWDFVENSGLFRVRSGLASARPENMCTYNPENVINSPERGVPFGYGYKSSALDDTSMSALFVNDWIKPSDFTAANTIGLISKYNTDYFKNNGFANEYNVRLDFALFYVFEVDGNVIAAATDFKTVYLDNIINFDFSFTQNVIILGASTGKSVTVNSEKLQAFSDGTNGKNGIIIETFDEVAFLGFTGKITAFCVLYNGAFSTNLAGGSQCSGGFIMSENYRFSYIAHNNSFYTLPSGDTKNPLYTVGHDDNVLTNDFIDFYRDGFKDFENGSYFIRYQTNQVYNTILTSALTWYDLKTLICTASPFYRINGAYYVAEFTDDYYITGKLIPYSDAREWQKFINPDKNDFNPDDIPEPTPPEPEDTPDTYGQDITGFDFTLTPLSAANNFTTLYAMTTSGIAEFGRTLWAKLWSSDFWQSVGTTFLNDFSINPADMMRYFISLRYFPFDLSVYPYATTDGVYVGRAVEPIAVNTRVFTRNLIQFSGGVCAVPELYHDYRDFEPCTNVEVTVPFCGNVQIAPSECVGKVLTLDYTVDMQTGAITALIYVNSDKKYIVARLSGTCSATIPITADNNFEFVGRIAKVTGSMLFDGIKSGAEMFKESESVKGSIGVGAVVGLASGAASMTGLPSVAVHKMGESGGFANYGGASRAYITVTRQKYSTPSNYGHAVGYAADFTAQLGNLYGLVVCQNVDTSGINCNSDERDEIKRLLESGVYI